MLWWTLRQLRSKNEKTRTRAAKELGRSGDPRVLEPLAEALLTDDGYEVREAAAKALGNFGVRAVEPLRLVIKRGRHRGIEDAVELLLRIGGAEAQRALQDAVEPLAAAISANSFYPDTKIEQLKKISSPEAQRALANAVVKLAAVVTKGDWISYGRARRTLSRIGTPEADRALREAAQALFGSRNEDLKNKLAAAEREGSPVELLCEECCHECKALAEPVSSGSIMVMTREVAEFAARYCEKCQIIVCGRCVGVSSSSPLGLTLGGRRCPRCDSETGYAAICHVRKTRAWLESA